jgi:hypothetical protein
MAALLLALPAVLSGAAGRSGLDPVPSASPVASPAASPVGRDPLPVEQTGAVPVSLTVRNLGPRPDHLLGGESPVAERVEPVAVEGFGDGRRVRRLADGFAVPGGGSVLLEPGGVHLLLVGLRRDLVRGQAVPILLRFARAGEMAVEARVRRRQDAAGVAPIPPVAAGTIEVSLVSVPPASLRQIGSDQPDS